MEVRLIVKAEHIARYIINRAVRNDGRISCLSLGKLMILAQYSYFYKYGQPLFPDVICYQKYGANVHQITKEYPSTIYDIVEKYYETKSGAFRWESVEIQFSEDIFTDAEKTTINEMVDSYKELNYMEYNRLISEYEEKIGDSIHRLNIVRQYVEARPDKTRDSAGRPHIGSSVIVTREATEKDTFWHPFEINDLVKVVGHTLNSANYTVCSYPGNEETYLIKNFDIKTVT